MSRRPPSRKDFERLNEHFGKLACEMFNKDGEACPQVFVLELGEAVGDIRKMAMLEPGRVQKLLGSDESKDRLAAEIRAIISPEDPRHKRMVRTFGFDPNIAVQINEVWYLGPAELADHEPDDELPQPSQSRQRREAIVVAMHCPVVTIVGMHLIDSVKRKATWAPIDWDMQQAEGRFVLAG
jgi:hypothetical protein